MVPKFKEFLNEKRDVIIILTDKGRFKLSLFQSSGPFYYAIYGLGKSPEYINADHPDIILDYFKGHEIKDIKLMKDLK